MTSIKNIRRIPWTYPTLAACIFLAIGVQLWAALLGPGNFDSDQAVMGLQIKHILEGKELPIYLWGLNFHGTLYSYLSVPLLWLLGTDNVFAMRIVSVLLMSVIFCLYAVIVTRLWDIKTAILTALFFTIPGMYVLLFTMQPDDSTAMRIILTTTALLLFIRRDTFTPRQQTIAVAAFGMLMGLGLWTHPSFRIDIGIYALAWLLASREWKRLWDWGEHLKMPLHFCISIVGLCFCLVAIMPMFHDASIQLRIGTSIAMGLGLLLLATIVLLASDRKAALIQGNILFIAGFLIGNGAQLAGWVLIDTAPYYQSQFIIPGSGNIKIWAESIIPAFFGITRLPSGSGFLSAMHPVIWMTTFVAIIGTLLLYVFYSRRLLLSAAMSKPLDMRESNRLAVALFFIVPLTALFFFPIGGTAGVRHIVFAWPAACIVLALGYRHLFGLNKYAASALLTVHLLTVGISNILAENRMWSYDQGRPLQFSIESLERYLQSKGVFYGYADYWTAYMVDYITDERLTIAEYTGTLRFPPYTQSVGETEMVAYVLWPRQTLIPGDQSSALDLQKALAKTNHTVRQWFPHVLERLDHATVMERKTISNFDVWIIRDDLLATKK
jgi:hypothetical protein